jgi:penicillin-binding protein 1A
VRLFCMAVGGLTLLVLLIGYGVLCSYIYVAPSLPSVEKMRQIELQVPLRVYTRSGALIAQIGEQRRIPVSYEEIPVVVRQAFLAAEDDRFFEHAGVDYPGVIRALFVNIVSGDRTQGASTITMQAARTMFLSPEKTWRRKLAEMFVTYRMEHEFSKQEILSLYLNAIFFGQRAYGIAAAAETFFGKTLTELTVGEAATLAGLPKAPSYYNPITNPQLASGRRSYVLRRMEELEFIDAPTAEKANKEVLSGKSHAPRFQIEAPYVAEMVRLALVERFGAGAERLGYKVYTTIEDHLQTAANLALRRGLGEYDRRHGWRGPIGRSELNVNSSPEQFDDELNGYSSVAELSPALLLSLNKEGARVFVKGQGFALIKPESLAWALRNQAPDKSPLNPGDIVYAEVKEPGVATLSQLPQAQSAFVALSPENGAITALVGGYDYFINKYNRVTQARRLPGSGFKPFLYSAALENGFNAASVLLDAPIVLDGEDLETAWRPENSTGEFGGPTRLREALVRSRNLVSIRLLRAMGMSGTLDYLARFGFERQTMPANLTLALGTLQTTPLDIAVGYAVFANGGFKITPYFIDRIENAAGEVVWQAQPLQACELCLPEQKPAPRVISAQNAWLMSDMMRDVIRRGTGRRALSLGRDDIAGKTGTTNDVKDAWFNGFTANLVATTWVGFDQEQTLGESEEGSKTALPIWIRFMEAALKDVPPITRPMPDGLITLRVSRESGRLTSEMDPDSVVETFLLDRLPGGAMQSDSGVIPDMSEEPAATAEPIF